MIKIKRRYRCHITFGKPYQQSLFSNDAYRKVCDRFDNDDHYVINICSLEELLAVEKYFQDIETKVYYYIRFKDVSKEFIEMNYNTILYMFTDKKYCDKVKEKVIHEFISQKKHTL